MAESLRDTISAAFDEHTGTPDAGTDPGQVVPGVIPGEPAPAAAPAEPPKLGRTAGRARDEQGKLLPGKPQKQEQQGTPVSPPSGVPQAAPAVQRPQRPASWKKEMWEHWDKLDPQVAAYLRQREDEYQRGVSTYKSEWDQVKPIAEAIAHFQPLLQQHGIAPAQWITNLGNAHRALATGSPQDRLSMFVKLAQDYQVPINDLFVQGQDGKLYFNPQIQAPQPQQQRQAEQPDVRALVREELLEHQTAQEIRNFVEAKDDKGQPKYPYFEELRETMLGLLQANLATDLPDAHKQALALPRHADLAAQLREQEERANAERNAAQAQAQAQRAKTKAISPRGSTPAAPAGTDRPKTVRAAIESAFDSVVGGGRL